MKISTYTAHKIISAPLFFVIGVCSGINNVVWFYCHYVYGRGPTPNYKYSIWKLFVDGFRGE